MPIVPEIAPVPPGAGLARLNVGPEVCVSETKVELAGTTVESATVWAASGPAFATVTVYEILLPDRKAPAEVVVFTDKSAIESRTRSSHTSIPGLDRRFRRELRSLTDIGRGSLLVGPFNAGCAKLNRLVSLPSEARRSHSWRACIARMAQKKPTWSQLRVPDHVGLRAQRASRHSRAAAYLVVQLDSVIHSEIGLRASLCEPTLTHC